MICGLVLAGGRSSRFGREKAMAELGGRPLIGWAVAVLEREVGALAVSARDGSGAADYANSRGWTVLADAADGPEGPLAGIAGGLRWAGGLRAEALFTVPCDAPFLPADLLTRLAASRTANGPAVARTAEGLEPLCALWPTS